MHLFVCTGGGLLIGCLGALISIAAPQNVFGAAEKSAQTLDKGHAITVFDDLVKSDIGFDRKKFEHWKYHDFCALDPFNKVIVILSDRNTIFFVFSSEDVESLKNIIKASGGLLLSTAHGFSLNGGDLQFIAIRFLSSRSDVSVFAIDAVLNRREKPGLLVVYVSRAKDGELSLRWDHNF